MTSSSSLRYWRTTFSQWSVVSSQLLSGRRLLMIPIAAAAGGSDDGSDDNVQRAQTLLLRLGHKRFGKPPAEIEQQIREIADLGRLEELCMRLLNAASWQDLAAERPSSEAQD